MDWWFLSGKILNKDLPFEAAEPSGIFQAFNLYTKPSVEKNKTEVCVFTDSVCTTESSFLVVIPVFPLPPLFWILTLFNEPLLMYPCNVTVINTDCFWIVSSIS